MAVKVRPRTTSFNTEVAFGRVRGTTYHHAFGRNSDIDTASGFEAIWNGGGAYTGFNATAAETVEVFSSSASDTSAGVGARTARLFGLDSDYLEQTEDITLNGVTPVVSTKSFIRCHEVQVLTGGSSGENVGTITVRQSATTANVFAVMPIGYNRSMIAAYTIPANKQGAVSNAFATISNKTNGVCNVRAKARSFGSVFTVRGEVSVLADGSSFVQLDYDIPSGIVPPKTDYFIEADSSVNNMAISAGFELILEEI